MAALSARHAAAEALARGLLRGWIDRQTCEPIMNRDWQAVAARVNPDGTVKDVCSSTGARPTKEYYLNGRSSAAPTIAAARWHC